MKTEYKNASDCPFFYDDTDHYLWAPQHLNNDLYHHKDIGFFLYETCGWFNLEHLKLFHFIIANQPWTSLHLVVMHSDRSNDIFPCNCNTRIYIFLNLIVDPYRLRCFNRQWSKKWNFVLGKLQNIFLYRERQENVYNYNKIWNSVNTHRLYLFTNHGIIFLRLW